MTWDEASEQPATILIVDDEPDILVALQDLFEPRYRVLTTTSPAEGLEILGRKDVALIISDQRMPGMTGDRFLKAAREITDAPSILLTGYADLSAVMAALNEGGVSGYVAKPWEPDALRAMVDGAVERVRLRRALQVEGALLGGLMENLPAAVAFKDDKGRIVRVNRLFAQALGRDCIGQPAPPASEAMRAAEAEAAASGAPVIIQEERASVWIEVAYVPILGPAGRHVAVLERDITIEKQAEARLRQADKLQALGTLAGGVAHDFNNLLTAILGSLELAARRLDDTERTKRYLENAAAAAERGAALTKRLLSFSRQDDGEVGAVDVAEALAGMEDLLDRTLGAEVTVELAVPPGLWPAQAEADQMELAVLNLCINARDAMPSGGVIVIGGENLSDPPDLPPGDYVAVTVADQGEGIAPDHLRRIFEPFFTTKPVGKGTGLGLSMVYGFAQRSGGTVTVESAEGSGTTVRLLLPRASEAAPPRIAPVRAETARSGGGKVLVVDDDDAVRTVTAGLLRELGYETMEAGDGPAALALLDGGAEPDLMVVDYAMPGGNGLEVARAVCARRPGLPVILVTGYAEPDIDAGDIPVLRKPFDEAALAAHIVRATAKKAS